MLKICLTRCRRIGNLSTWIQVFAVGFEQNFRVAEEELEICLKSRFDAYDVGLLVVMNKDMEF